MKMRSAKFFGLLALCSFVALPASAQGTLEDYARAKALRGKYESAAIDIAGPPSAVGRTHRFW